MSFASNCSTYIRSSKRSVFVGKSFRLKSSTCVSVFIVVWVLNHNFVLTLVLFKRSLRNIFIGVSYFVWFNYLLVKGGCSPQKKPKKTKKNQKKPKKTKPIYQFWCSDWFFFGFFLGFFGFFLVFFWFFLVFFGIFWDDILTLNLNTKKNQKIPKKTKKNQKKPTEPKKPDSNFECWPRPMPKKTKKSQKKPKKTKKNQFPISNSGQNQCQKKPKKTKKNQKKPMPIWKFKKTKKTKKNQKKTNANLPILV